MKHSKLYIVLLATILTTILASATVLRQRATIRLLRHNQTTLAEQLRLSDSMVGAERKSVGRLRLTVGELEELRQRNAKQIEAMGITLRHVNSTSATTLRTQLDTIIPPPTHPLPSLSDSTGHHSLAPQTITRYEWSDAWVNFSGILVGDSLRWSLSSRDTLFQVVHRVPYRWWIFRWGTKAVRQTISSSNPHSKIVYAEYIELE